MNTFVQNSILLLVGQAIIMEIPSNLQEFEYTILSFHNHGNDNESSYVRMCASTQDKTERNLLFRMHTLKGVDYACEWR